MIPATILGPGETRAVLSKVLRVVHGTDAQLEGWTSDSRFTEYGKKRVVRYDLEARVAGVPHLQRFHWLGKYYENDEDALRVAAAVKEIGASEGAHGAGLAVQTVLAYHAPLHLLFLTYESGESVSSAIGRETGVIVATIGRVLAVLHTMRIAPPAITSPATLLANLRPRLEDLRAWFPHEAASLPGAFAQLEEEAPRPPSPLSFVHNDFGPANLLWRGGQIVVLDFDKCTRGDPALDLGNFLVQLRRYSILKPERLRDFGSARRALLEAYGLWSSLDIDREDRVAWYERAILLHKVHRLVLEAKSQDPEGRARLIYMAHRLLRLFLEPSSQRGESLTVATVGSHPSSVDAEVVGGQGHAQVRGAGFPVDPDVPQLSVASNPQFMLEVFRRHLKAVSGKVYHIEECVPFRFRCRQSGLRHVLQYKLRVADPSSGRRWDQMVTGLLYADGGASRRWEEMKAEVLGMKIPESCLTFEPVVFISSLEMIVEVFPYDRKLRSLAPLVGGEVQGLEPWLLSRLGPGDWRVEERTIEPTRYRTELGAALRYGIRAHDAVSARSEEVRCYLKVHRDDRGAETFRILQSLSESRRDGENPYSVVRPVSYLSELRTVATEEAPGISLTQILVKDQNPSEELRLAARAVAAFNQDELPIERRRSLADKLAEVEGASVLVKWACPQLRDAVQAISDAVTKGLDEGEPAPIHGDLKPDHIFLSGRCVTLIDLDWAAMADPLLDPAQLLAYVTGRVGLDSVPVAFTEQAGATFIEEYFRLVPESWKRRFPLHRAAALLEVAAAIFRRQEPCWPEKITRVIEAAQHEISEGWS